MEPINVNLSCDIQQPVKVRYLDGYFFSKDSAGHKINVDVFDNGVPVSVGGSVSAEVIRSDGETVPVTGAVSENRAYVILPQAAYAVVGAVQITIKVTEGATIVTIACFVAYVHESDTEITVDPGTIIPSIQALISQIETAVASIPADYSSLWTSLAPAFSTSTAYAVGQYVTNSGVLYRFTTAHPAGTWNSAHVTAVNLGAEVSALKSALDYSELENPVQLSGWTTGGFSGDVGETITFNTTAQWQRGSFQPVYGKSYKIQFTNRTGISARSYVYAVDADGKILYKYADMPGQQSTSQLYTFILTFPADVVTVWVCGKNATGLVLLVYRLDPTTKVDDLQEEINEMNNVSDYNHGKFVTRKGDFISYYTGGNASYDGGANLGENTKYSYVLSMFDALAAMDNTHITKNVLGQASGTDENGNAYYLYEYVFSPHAYTGALSLDKTPVILIDACIHGFEKNSVYGLYYFLYDLINNYSNDTTLMAIRDNVIIKAIPVVNPYGFDRNYYYNANDVNINRNFAASDWTKIVGSETNNSGDEPFDQPESAIIRDWVNANKTNLMAYFNLHTNGMYYVQAYSDCNSLMPKFGRTNNDAYYGRLANVTKRHIQAQSTRIPGMYNGLPSGEFYGKYQTETGQTGTAAVWAAEIAKVVSMTFEVFNGIKINNVVIMEIYHGETKKLCSEMIGNITAQTIYEYSES